MKEFRKLLSALLTCLICISLIVGVSVYANGDTSTRRTPGDKLEYWLYVKYDGVDRNGVASNDTTIAKVSSDVIEVKDKLPEGLQFVDFIHENMTSGTFGAIPRDSSASGTCSGYVIDDTNDPSYDQGSDTTEEYTYHGLHYNKQTREVTFRVVGLSAGCQIEIGIETKLPDEIDDPNTTDIEEIRRDFYNSASLTEKGLTNKSNTLHDYLLKDTINEDDDENNGTKDMRTVTYVLDQGCDGFEGVPEDKQYLIGSIVSLEADLSDKERIRFDGWSSEDVTVSDGKFTMPNIAEDEKVTFTGACSIIPDDQLPEKYDVIYTFLVDEGAGPGLSEPDTRSYLEGETVKRDSLAQGTVLNGYEFEGWQTNDNIDIDSNHEFIMPNSEVNFTGKWKLIKYTVKYEYDNYDNLPDAIKNTLPDESEFIPNQEVVLPQISDQDNYIFIGWDKEDFEMPQEDVVVTGYWKVKEGSFTPEINIEILNSDSEPFKEDDEIEYKVTVKNDKSFPIYDVIIKSLNEKVSFVDINYTGSETPLTLLTDTELKIYEIAANSSFTFTYKHSVNKYDKDEVTSIVRIIDASSNNDYVFDDTVKDSSGKYLVEDSISVETTVADYNKVTISYHPNKEADDLLLEDKIITYEYEKPSEHTLLDNMFTPPTNQEFDKWSIGTPNQKISLEDDTTAKALWKPLGAQMVDVIFHENGHGVAPDSQRIVKGTAAQKPNDPTDEKYSFTGWYLEQECENLFNFEDAVNDNLNLYANWILDENKNDVEDTTEYRTITYTDGVDSLEVFKDKVFEKQLDGLDTPLFGDNPTRYNYVFTGWSPNLKSKIDGDQTYTATWADDKNHDNVPDVNQPYTIVFDLNGKDATNKPANQTKLYGEKIDRPEKDPEVSKAIFNGWCLDTKGEKPIDFENDYVKGHTTIYAHWLDDINENEIADIEEYRTITYKDGANGIVFSDLVFDKALDGMDTPLYEGEIKRNGYIFNGFNPKIDPIVNGNKTYIATWLQDENNNGIEDSKEIYTITFDPNGGNWDGSIDPIIIDYHYGESITIVDAPSKDGYIFEYWMGSRYQPGQKYKVIDNHTFTAIFRSINDAENKYIIPATGIDNTINKVLLFVVSLFTIVLSTYVLIRKRKHRSKYLSIILLAGLLLYTNISINSVVITADDVVQEVTSDKFLYTQEETDGFTITKEAHWTGLHEAELNITINSDKVYQPYDNVFIGVDVRSGVYDIEQIFDGSLTPENQYQTAVKEVLDKLNIADYTGKVFTYNATDSEQVNKKKENIQNHISLLLKNGTNTRSRKTSSSWGMDLFYGIHSALNFNIGWGPRTVKTYKTTSGSICDKNGRILEYNKDEFKFEYGKSCSVQKRNCAGPNDCKNNGPVYEDSNCSPLQGPPNKEVHGDRERPTASCELLEEIIDPTEVYTKTNNNILVVLFDSGESYISPEDRKSFTYHIPGPTIIVEETYPDGTKKIKTTQGPGREGTYSYETYHIYETQELIKEFFPNATIVTLRNSDKDSGRTYGKFFADATYTSNNVDSLIDSGILDGAGVNGLTFDITDNISDYFEAVSVKTDYGTVTLSENKDKVIWNHSNNMPTGSTRSIKVKLKLKDSSVDGIVPTNNGVTTNYKLKTQDSKTSGTTNITPTLKTKYSVTYDTNTPQGCVISNWTERRSPYEIVKYGQQELSCDGYNFKGYEFVDSESVKKLTSNTFVMPEKDLTLKAIWGKPTIAKENDGEVFVYVPSMSEFITNLYTSSEDDTVIKDNTVDENLRYVGTSPNNYVTFNGEEAGWRIIGVFDVDDGTGNKEKRVKLIRSTPLKNTSGGNIKVAWDTRYLNSNNYSASDPYVAAQYGNQFLYSAVNQWGSTTVRNGVQISGAYLQQKLNTDYLNGVSSNVSWRYGRWNNSISNTQQYNSEQSLNEDARKLIDDAVWYTGAVERKNTLTALDFYNDERSNKTPDTKRAGIVRTTTWTGKVGLLYPSDYFYSNSNPSSIGCTMGNSPSCIISNAWLVPSYYEYTITPFKGSTLASDDDLGVYVYDPQSGYGIHPYFDNAFNMNNNRLFATRPVVYLKTDVKRLSGTGTATDPYVIGYGD